MNVKILDNNPLVFTIDSFYSKAQCYSLIKKTEKLGKTYDR